jgi:hypothetical protein
MTALGPSLNGCPINRVRNLEILDAGDVLYDAFAVGRPGERGR